MPDLANKQIIPATGWFATYHDGERKPILAWAIDSAGAAYGLLLVGGLLVSVEDFGSFKEYAHESGYVTGVAGRA